MIAAEAIYTMIESVRVLQRGLYRAAKAQKERRFGVLYDKVYRDDILWAAWEQVRANGGGRGWMGKRSTRSRRGVVVQTGWLSDARNATDPTGYAGIHPQAGESGETAIGDPSGQGQGGAGGGEDSDRTDL